MLKLASTSAVYPGRTTVVESNSVTIAGPSTLRVGNTFGTTSGTNYLGLDNPDTAFYLGDSFEIDFHRTVHAVGLYVIAGSDALPTRIVPETPKSIVSGPGFLLAWTIA